MNLSLGVRDGMAYGFNPESHTISTNSVAWTRSKLLATVGINANSLITQNEMDFLNIVRQIGIEGGPIRLSAEGINFLDAAESNPEPSTRGEYSARIADMIDLEDSLVTKSDELSTVTFYTRTEEMMKAIYNDYFIEDFSKSYNISISQDETVVKLIGGGYDELVVTLSTLSPVALFDMPRPSSRPGILLSMAKSLASFIFPVIDDKIASSSGNGIATATAEEIALMSSGSKPEDMKASKSDSDESSSDDEDAKSK
jgi:hypothetical protein